MRYGAAPTSAYSWPRAPTEARARRGWTRHDRERQQRPRQKRERAHCGPDKSVTIPQRPRHNWELAAAAPTKSGAATEAPTKAGASCSGPDRTVSFCGGPDRSGSDLAVGHWAPIESVVNPDGPDKIVYIPNIQYLLDTSVCLGLGVGSYI